MRKPKYSKVKNQANLYRDNDTNAIINNDKLGYKAYLANREKLSSDRERIEDLETNVAKINENLDTIKDLLTKLAEDK